MKVGLVGDWGTSRLRLWKLHDGIPADQVEGPGIGLLHESPMSALASAVGHWPDLPGDAPITLCGMAGARNGLHETDYIPIPASASSWRDACYRGVCLSRPLRIAAGLVSAHGTLADRDVMRGEEAQVFGAMAADPRLAQGPIDFVLPGTHSKWVRVKDGCVERLSTFMTGEIFALLQNSSLFALRASDQKGDHCDASGFEDGLSFGDDHGRLLATMFKARVGQLLDGHSAGWAREFLSGVLIAAEVANARGENIGSGAVRVIGEPALAGRYARALRLAGSEAEVLDAEACTLAGLGLLNECR